MGRIRGQLEDQRKLAMQAKVCSTYLSFDKFAIGSCQNDKEFEERLEEKRLYDYAAHYWGVHAREAHDSPSELIKFLEKKCQVQASAQALYVVTSSWSREYSKEFPKKVTALHLIAYFRTEHVARAFLANGTTDLKDDNGETPLSWAAKYGHEAVVKLLLATGKVDVDSTDSQNRTPLSWAAEYGQEVIVRLLLATEKVEVDPKDSLYNQTPLSWAAWGGHEAVVKLLLATEKVDVNSKDSLNRTPLSRAAEYGQEAVVKLLLSTEKVDVDSKDSKFNQTSLSKAARTATRRS